MSIEGQENHVNKGEKNLVRRSVLFFGQNEAVFRLHMDERQLFYFRIGKS